MLSSVYQSRPARPRRLRVSPRPIRAAPLSSVSETSSPVTGNVFPEPVESEAVVPELEVEPLFAELLVEPFVELLPLEPLLLLEPLLPELPEPPALPEEASTTIVPCMNGWIVQKYEKVPG